MTRAQLLAELQAVLNSETGANCIIAETTLIGYLAEGQDKFCEETGYIRDTTNYTVTLATDTAVYDLSDRIIQVLNVWDGNRKLGKVVQDGQLSYDDWPTTYDTSTTTGLPTHWRTDKETGIIEFYPTPTADYNDRSLTLQVWRYSQYDLAGDGATPGTAADPEIHSRFQRACIEWALYKAFSHHDMEAQEPMKARDHLAAFNSYVSDGIAQFRRIHNLETRVGVDPAYRT